MKVCWVSIIGRPNVGKSTLINKIIDYNLSIVSSKAQTTRDQILGIYNDEEYQLIFIDTPGIHKPLSQLGNELNQKAYESLNDADLILFLSPANEKMSKGDEMIFEKIKKFHHKLAIITKSDLANNNQLIEKQNELKNLNFDAFVSTSSKDENSIYHLIDIIKSFAKEDQMFYESDYITDKSELFIAKEIIRWAAIENLSDELPHSIAIEITKYDENKGHKNIDAIIYCKKESQKGIIIGKNGSMIKKIGTLARKTIANQFNNKIILNLKVKVNENWINNEKEIKKFGY